MGKGAHLVWCFFFSTVTTLLLLFIEYFHWFIFPICQFYNPWLNLVIF
uniref:Uncharacterized protein n=1 Tax=Rhizophora mucronata TaxID=61149 RepID=A0A2P2R2T4_RHIMU